MATVTLDKVNKIYENGFHAIHDLDLQIASIALSHGLPLVTHNTAHFNRIPGLVLVDWLA